MKLPTNHKYHAKKTIVDNITFDSKAEAAYYQRLKLLQRAGEVIEFELQPEFCIIEGYIHPRTGKKIRATYYKADFRVKYRNGTEEIIDVKGVRTPLYQLKKKLVEAKYGIEIKEVTA